MADGFACDLDGSLDGAGTSHNMTRGLGDNYSENKTRPLVRPRSRVG